MTHNSVHCTVGHSVVRRDRLGDGPLERVMWGSHEFTRLNLHTKRSKCLRRPSAGQMLLFSVYFVATLQSPHDKTEHPPALTHTYTTEKLKKHNLLNLVPRHWLDFCYSSINHEKRNPPTPLTSNATNIYPTCLSGQVPFTVFVCACACVGV